ncbi:unnamed protein product [Brachionus calyciflorus]|uniref:FERM domain-containing protein n=1 Tax=Brachionus calyciflorus TaxID=104777 RepID=A0A813PFP9_9BILA|nr:unnamed protein product [Brachionus calyciflorus]
MPPKPVNVRVVTMDAELEFSIQQTTTGKQLFDQVVKTIGLREIWYFGLQYKDTKGLLTWLKLNKKVLSQDISKESPLLFKFRAKYFPEDASEEIIQDITLRMFFLQVKESILSEEIYCPPETCVLLASYATQAKYGDYNPAVHVKDFLATDKLLPKKVTDQYQYTESEWHDRIINWYKEHVGVLREEAMMEYLKIAQDLEMYGVNYFEIKNKKGTDLWLGVDALGLNIYEKEDKLTPRIGFPWSEIRNISFNDKKFTIKPVDRKSSDFIFFASRLRINKRILALCMGNHELYMRRRKDDSIEVQQMKAQAKEEKLLKEKERQTLQKERQARELAEKEKNELLEKLNRLEEEANKARDALEEQTRLTRDLEERRQRAEEERKRLEQERIAAEQEQKRALERANLEKEERERMAAAAEEARLLAEEKAEEARKKAEEAQRLEEELLNAQRKVEESQRKLADVSTKNWTTPAAAAVVSSNGSSNSSFINQNHNHFGANGSNSSSSISNHLAADDNENDEDDEAKKENGVELKLNESLPPEQYREPAVDKNQKMKQQLEELRRDLNQVKDVTKQTKEDSIHQDNLKEGRDKYKTLKQIRQVVIIGMLSSSMVSAWGGDGWGWNRRGPNWGRGHGRNWGWGGWNRGRGCGGPRC